MTTTARRGRVSADVRRSMRDMDEQIARIADRVSFVIGIDPASKRTGFSILTVGGRLLDAVLISASHRNKHNPTLRIREIVADLRGVILAQPWPDRDGAPLPPTVAIAVEIGNARRSRTAERSGGQGLPVYGRAVGRVEALALELAHDADAVVSVDQRTWNGSAQKGRTAAAVRAEYPELDAARDPKNDVADAVGIARWLIGRINLARMEPRP